MYSRCARKTGYAVYAVLNCLFTRSHKVCKLVYDNDYSRHFIVSVAAYVRIVALNISVADLRKVFHTALHLLNGPVERADCLVGIADNFIHKQMRNTCVNSHFHPLGVYENKTHVVGRRLIKQAYDKRVYAAALARSRSARDKHVRQLSDLRHAADTVQIFTYRKGSGVFFLIEFGRFYNLAERNYATDFIRHFYAYGVLAGDRRDNTHAVHLHFHSYIAFVAANGADRLTSRHFNLKLIERKCRTDLDFFNLAFDVEEIKSSYNTLLFEVVILVLVLLGLGRVKQTDRRRNVRTARWRSGLFKHLLYVHLHNSVRLFR